VPIIYEGEGNLFVLDRLRSNLQWQQLENHIQNGLKEVLSIFSQRQVDRKQRHLLRKDIYALDNLLGGNSFTEEEMFNGFRDELTDFAKYKRKGVGY